LQARGYTQKDLAGRMGKKASEIIETNFKWASTKRSLWQNVIKI
jgi:transcriptional regulator with XRE-family HTH domain